MSALDWLSGFSDRRIAQGLRRELHPRSPSLDGLLDLASNDYLGLARHPEVIKAAQEAAHTWGTGATASRLVTGTTHLHAEFEEELADFVGTESALLFSSGYLANLSVITALTDEHSLIISDTSNHASIVDACRLARGHVFVAPHKDVAAMHAALESTTATAVDQPSHMLISDAVFSVDGDQAPLAELTQVAHTHEAVVVVDEAHSLGTMGDRGQGLTSELNLQNSPGVVITATLSKALGSQGGVVLGTHATIAHLIDAARPFIFDTALSPMNVAAAQAALHLIKQDPELPKRARTNAHHLADLATSLGFEVSQPDAAVVSLVIDRPQDAVAARDLCAAHGVRVGCFRPPSVPDGRSRLRLTARADLGEPELACTAAALAAVAHAGWGV
jgi:8-amino-7-oxononanoate synthase